MAKKIPPGRDGISCLQDALILFSPRQTEGNLPCFVFHEYFSYKNGRGCFENLKKRDMLLNIFHTKQVSIFVYFSDQNL